MDKATLRALNGSILKWKGIVAGTVEDEGDINCPLCQRFHPNYRTDGKVCAGCPIAAATGDTMCDGSPYEIYAHFEGSEPDMAKTAAVVMLNFLKALAPKKKRRTSDRAGK